MEGVRFVVGSYCRNVNLSKRPFGSRIMKEPRECHCCGRVIAMRFAVGSNKAHVRHKCPHGEWCVSGHKNEGIHANAPKCNKCRDVVYAHLRSPKN